MKCLLGKDRDSQNEMWRKVVKEAVEAEKNGALSARKGERAGEPHGNLSCYSSRTRIIHAGANWNGGGETPLKCLSKPALRAQGAGIMERYTKAMLPNIRTTRKIGSVYFPWGIHGE